LAGTLGVSDRVTFLGAVTDPGQALAHFDIFALSSDTEQMPMSVLEAMAMALPIVSVDVGDVKRMIAPANRGLAIAKSDEAGFAAALDALAADPERRAELGRLNRQHVRDTYPWQTMIEAYDRVFNEF
jgi:glycosyltransferase involved in cell wall biosynthesis